MKKLITDNIGTFGIITTGIAITSLSSFAYGLLFIGIICCILGFVKFIHMLCEKEHERASGNY